MIVYKTTNLINGKFYVGADTNNNPEYFGSGLLLNRAIKKYGIENFSKITLESCKTKKDVFIRERYWIEKLNAREIGYNIAEGGHGGNTYTEETKKRVSEAMTGVPKSKETRERMSKAQVGHVVLPHVREIASKTHKGKTISDEHKKKCSDFMKNFDGYSDKWIEQQHKSGADHPMYGRKHSDETKLKMEEAHQKRTPEQKLETYKKMIMTKYNRVPTDEQLEEKLTYYRERL